MAVSKSQVSLMKARLAHAASVLKKVGEVHYDAETVEELLNEIDGCSAAIREYYDQDRWP